MPFLFVWTAMIFIPLIMSTGVVGLVSYLQFLWPSMSSVQGDLVGIAVVVLVVVLLWRKVESIGKLSVVMWAVMLVAVAALIIASLHPLQRRAGVHWPAHAIQLTHGQFWIGFASGLTIGIYDYLGYNTASYMGAEIKQPGRTMPRAIIFSIISVMVHLPGDADRGARGGQLARHAQHRLAGLQLGRLGGAGEGLGPLGRPK